MQDKAIINVVIITVALRPTLSPIHPNKTAPTGLKIKVVQKVKLATRTAV
jgi:hypothetical protein